jgi:hypothetical protein
MMGGSTTRQDAPPSHHKSYILNQKSFPERPMAWAIVILCAILGSMGALRPSMRARDFKREKEEK